MKPHARAHVGGYYLYRVKEVGGTIYGCCYEGSVRYPYTQWTEFDFNELTTRITDLYFFLKTGKVF